MDTKNVQIAPRDAEDANRICQQLKVLMSATIEVRVSGRSLIVPVIHEYRVNEDAIEITFNGAAVKLLGEALGERELLDAAVRAVSH